MGTASAEMLEALGAKNITTFAREERRARAGARDWARRGWATIRRRRCSHQFLQTHDIKNLFVMDGSSFPSVGWQNPTLTIMALAVRSTDFLMQQFKRRNL